MPKRFLLWLFFLCVTSAFSQGTWTQKASYPGYADMGCPGFAINDKGYISSGGGPNNFWEYDPITNAWTIKASFPDPSNGALTFTINGKGYIGGIFGSSNFWEYDPLTDSWTQRANFPGTQRQCAVGFSIGTKGYITTGNDYPANNVMNDMWEWDQTTNTWTQKANFPGDARTAAVGFSIGNKGYAGTGIGNNYYQDFWEYDPVTDTWTQKANFGGGSRSEATGFSIGSFGYIGLGTSDVGFGDSSDVWKFDPVNNLWSRAAYFSGNIREFATGFSIECKGYIGMGFINDDGSTRMNDLWEYSPDTCQLSGITGEASPVTAILEPTLFSTETNISLSQELKDATLTIYNMNGQEMKHIAGISGKNVCIRKENLAVGMYVVQLQQNNKTILTKRVVIENQ